MVMVPILTFIFFFCKKTSQELRNCPNWAKKGFIERKAALALVGYRAELCVSQSVDLQALDPQMHVGPE